MIRRAGPPSVHALGTAAAAAALLGVAAVVPLDAPLLSLFSCPFRAATALPCFACGCTHAFHFAVRGQLGDALISSPLGTLFALACGAHVCWTLLRLCGLPWAPQLELTRAGRWTAALAILANWTFLALRALP